MTVSDAAAPTRTQLLAVGAFFGLSLALAAVAYVAALPPALMPFVLASGPTIIAIALA